MKVKVITITGESNYGNSLQNYAVIQTLNSLGCEAQTVKTEYEPNFTKLCKKKSQNLYKGRLENQKLSLV